MDSYAVETKRVPPIALKRKIHLSILYTHLSTQGCEEGGAYLQRRTPWTGCQSITGLVSAKIAERQLGGWLFHFYIPAAFICIVHKLHSCFSCVALCWPVIDCDLSRVLPASHSMSAGDRNQLPP
uniref:Uncharacterized protein n=1 Tax=Fundulus heteroclitus TaxID=8078 RepID=A0A3Q2NMJ4_FUNHE